MPVRKKDNKKNLSPQTRKSAIIPTKEESTKERLVVEKTGQREKTTRVDAKTTSGKRKKG